MSLTISIVPSGRSFPASADDTILMAAIREGVGLPYACKDGTCGTCKCKVASGSVMQGPHLEQALTTADKQEGFILTCCSKAAGDVVLVCRHVTDERCYPVRKMAARVTLMERRSHDVMLLRLLVAGTEPVRYHAGQYIDVLLRDGSRRSYSMASEPKAAGDTSVQLELHIRHMPGGRFTDHVFGTMKEKDVLRIEGPFGSFYLREESNKPLVFLASGTGFAPIKAFIEQMQSQRVKRDVSVYWGGRQIADLYFHDWMKQKRKEMPNLRYIPVLSDPKSPGAWEGRTGYVHQAVMDDIQDMSNHQVYACGAPVVVESARKAYVDQLQLPPDEFYADAFTSQVDRLAA